MASLEQVLGWKTLLGVIQKTKSGIPDPLPPGFRAATKKTIGDKGSYTRVTGQRKAARQSMYGSSARKRELRNVAEVPVVLMLSFEEQVLPPLVMQALRAYDSYAMQQLGKDEVARQVGEFVKLFTNLEVAAILQLLALGHIYFDGGGELLPSSAGAVIDVDFGVSANNQNQLNGLLTTSWDDPTADIPVFFRSLKQRAAQQHGYEPLVGFYGKNVPSYIQQSDSCLDYLARNPKFNEKFQDSGEIPNGLFGINQWIPVYATFYEDQNGANQTFFSDDQITFTPEVSGDWWDYIEGSYLIPTTLNVVADGIAGMDSMEQVFGQFAYGCVTHNPVSVTTYHGNTFLPCLKNPDVVYQAIVKF